MLAPLALLLYVWQMADAWADEAAVFQYGQYGAIHGTAITHLMGKGVAIGAIGILYVDYSSAQALLQVQEMPTLPASEIYQVWCIDTAGRAVASSTFRVAVDSQDSSTVFISAPHMVATYPHFLVTIEPDGGSVVPSGPVVLTN